MSVYLMSFTALQLYTDTHINVINNTSSFCTEIWVTLYLYKINYRISL